jgi:hypothetical protein
VRIVIDIDGDQVRVHRVEGEESPPADVLERAAAINAQSAGVAKFRQPEATVDSVRAIASEDLALGASDAGRAPARPTKTVVRRRKASTSRAAARKTRKQR